MKRRIGGRGGFEDVKSEWGVGGNVIKAGQGNGAHK